ncbi:MAG: hypothetical protein Ta2A_07930 [Treponemataceae bacterium]|nr:MAG: hypothetical protein Ta2A_07930 [Treponemataceae bacterium]
MLENFGIICGVTLGLFGSVFSVVQFFYQRHKDKEQAERETQRDKEQSEKQDLRDRLTFLTQVIIDKDIPRESRQPFFDEYVAKGGNGTVIKFWLENK